jgi:hypothetical protein
MVIIIINLLNQIYHPRNGTNIELNKKPDRTSNDIFDKLKEIEKNKIYCELDNRITIKEITEAMCCGIYQ